MKMSGDNSKSQSQAQEEAEVREQAAGRRGGKEARSPPRLVRETRDKSGKGGQGTHPTTQPNYTWAFSMAVTHPVDVFTRAGP